MTGDSAHSEVGGSSQYKEKMRSTMKKRRKRSGKYALQCKQASLVAMHEGVPVVCLCCASTYSLSWLIHGFSLCELLVKSSTGHVYITPLSVDDQNRQSKIRNPFHF